MSGCKSDAVARDAERIVRQLGGKWQGDYAMCRCPAHADGDPSLSVRVGRSAVLFHCFAGCTSDAIVDALRTGHFAPMPGHDPGRRHSGGKADFNKLALSTWRFADPFIGSLAERYIRARAIVPTGITARFDAHCQFGGGEDKAFAPALIVPVEEDAGVVAIHRTFLRPDGKGKAAIASLLRQGRAGKTDDALRRIEGKLQEKFPDLSHMERAVLARAALAMPPREIARSLAIKATSVKTYRSRALTKLGQVDIAPTLAQVVA